MSGAGKWIKKNPVQALGLLAGAAIGGPAIAGLLGGAGGAAAGAATSIAPELAGGLGAGAADEMLSAVPATFGDKFATFAGNAALGIDKMAPYAKLAGQAEGLLSPDQQQMPAPMAQRPQMVAQGGMGGLLPYGDAAEEEKWRRMQQSGRFYG